MARSRTVREGSVGLLAIFGVVIFGGIIVWLRNFEFGEDSYNFTVTFPDVNGVQVGAPVRYRGYRVGRIQEIKPSTDGVDVTLKISQKTLEIPQNVEILANSTGLIGETSVDITPMGELPEGIESLNPTSPQCDSNLIICEDERVPGQPGPQLVPTLARLSDLYGSDEFFNNLNSAAQNTAFAAEQISVLSKELASLSSSVQQEIKTFSGTANSIATTANETTELIDNVNNLLSENQSSLTTTLDDVSVAIRNFSTTSRNLNTLIDGTSEDLSSLISNLDATVSQTSSQLESVDIQEIVQNLETLTANATEVSENLNELTGTLADPTNTVVLQETLDSARATFENTQKITADLEQLTGDPQLRNNLRELINGLSDLVSSSEQLQQQVEAVQDLALLETELDIDPNQKASTSKASRQEQPSEKKPITQGVNLRVPNRSSDTKRNP